ncbi:MAG TPA: segregation/condensation protein A, partial [bacterium]|nr:segregation/condensation protein A [bacterium]
MAEPNYQLKLAVFEGPFDLLLYLIKRNQID